jgi:pyruvoyl-dependent arginine decarboxylase (PvlArgDC)
MKMRGQLSPSSIVWVIMGTIGAVIIANIISTSLGNFTGVDKTIVGYISTIFILGVFAGIAYMSGLAG